MPKKKHDEIICDHNNDGIERRGFLKCVVSVGTGTFCAKLLCME